MIQNTAQKYKYKGSKCSLGSANSSVLSSFMTLFLEVFLEATNRQESNKLI